METLLAILPTLGLRLCVDNTVEMIGSGSAIASYRPEDKSFGCFGTPEGLPLETGERPNDKIRIYSVLGHAAFDLYQMAKRQENEFAASEAWLLLMRLCGQAPLFPAAS